jgi:hypothetical protein
MTHVTPSVMVMSPQEAGWDDEPPPQPMAVAELPPAVAVTEPPVMVMLPQVPSSPLPMPGP